MASPSTSIDDRTQELRAPGRRGPGPLDLLLGLVAVGAGLLAALGLYVADPPEDLVTLGLTLLVCGVLGFMAMYRFEWFLLATLVIRPSLDDLKAEALDVLQPSAILGLLLIFVVVLRSVADVAIGEKVFATPMAKAWGLCVLLFMFSYPTSLNRAESLPAVLGLLSSLALYLAVERTFRADRSSLSRIMIALGVGLIIPVTTALVQYVWTGSTDQISGLSRLDGSFSHYNPFATYLVIMLLLGLATASASSTRLRLAAIIPLSAAFFVLIFTYARAAWLSFIVALLISTWRLDKRLTLFVGVVIVAMAALLPGVGERLANITADTGTDGGAKTDDSLSWRINYWGEVLPLFWRNPVTGVGLQVVPLLTVTGSRPHNSFVQAAVEGGLLGLLGWLTLVATATVACLKGWKLVSSDANMTGLERAVVLGSIAATASVVIQLLSENILTDTVIQWYLNVALAHLAVMVWIRRPAKRRPEIDLSNLPPPVASEAGADAAGQRQLVGVGDRG